MKTSYEEMLEKAYKELPEQEASKERFEIPKVRGHIQGNKTIVSNWHQIASALGRKAEHLTKYITKELATPADLKKSYIIFGSKISAARLNEKIDKYAEEFVICKECGKPDTKLIKEGSYMFMRCLACGAKHSVKAKI